MQMRLLRLDSHRHGGRLPERPRLLAPAAPLEGGFLRPRGPREAHRLHLFLIRAPAGCFGAPRGPLALAPFVWQESGPIVLWRLCLGLARPPFPMPVFRARGGGRGRRDGNGGDGLCFRGVALALLQLSR